MNEIWERRAEIAGRMVRLVKDLGRPAVLETLGVGEEELSAMESGSAEMDEGSMANLEKVMAQLGDVGASPAAEDEAEAEPSGEEGPDAGKGGEGPGSGEVGPAMPEGVRSEAASTEGSWLEKMEQKRFALRDARALAEMTQFRLGMTHQEHVTALGLVTRVELALISYFHESVPEPGVAWDGERRAREIDRRLKRLRWVEEEQAKEYGGVKGLLKKLGGRGQVSGKELVRRMQEEADQMFDVINTRKEAGVLADMLRYRNSSEAPGRR